MKYSKFVSNAFLITGFAVFVGIQVLGRNGMLSQEESALSTAAIYGAMGLSMIITASAIRIALLVDSLTKGE